MLLFYNSEPKGQEYYLQSSHSFAAFIHLATVPILQQETISRDSEIIILGGRSGNTVVKYVNILNIQTGKIKEITMQWKEKLTAFVITKQNVILALLRG
jgi:hypothetical protein